MVMVMGDKVDRHERREERKKIEDERNVPVLPLGITASTILSSSVAHLHFCVCLVLHHHVARTWFLGGCYSTHGANNNGLEGGTPRKA